MYSMYFKLLPRIRQGRNIQSKQTHEQYGGYNDMSLELTVSCGDAAVTVRESSNSYSDPDGLCDSYSSYRLTASVGKQEAKALFLYHIRQDDAGQRLKSGTHDLEQGSITLLSTQNFSLNSKEMDEGLWKILWIFKYHIHTAVGGYTADSLKFCEKVLKKLLKTYLGADTKEAHLILFHQFYYYGDRSDGAIEAKAAAYGWDLDALHAEAARLVGTYPG